MSRYTATFYDADDNVVYTPTVLTSWTAKA